MMNYTQLALLALIPLAISGCNSLAETVISAPEHARYLRPRCGRRPSRARSIPA